MEHPHIRRDAKRRRAGENAAQHGQGEGEGGERADQPGLRWANFDERQDAHHHGAKAEHQHDGVAAERKQDNGAAAAYRDRQMNVIRIGSGLARRMQIVAEHPLPHRDSGRKAERGFPSMSWTPSRATKESNG